MAFNLGIPEIKESTGDVLLKRPKYEYYIEWWKLGSDAKDIEAGQFRTSNLKHFITVFKGHKHLSLVFLKRCHDDRVLYDMRTGSRQV
jgi:hypothetical protein